MAIRPYLDLMDHIIAARTDVALRALIPAIRDYVALHPATRFDFGEMWSMQWAAHVRNETPPELWNN